MISQETALVIAQRWIDLWNDKSVEEYLTQYRDDVVLVSSLALRLFPDSKGTMTDKKVLLNYWSLVRQKFPNYRFTLNAVSTFENKVVIYYSALDNSTKAICILTVDNQGMIYRVEVSYV
ncbi:MAG: nuclear transport factor 2 family protein [Bacteroidetes bacterium]|nr:nuclear transport factor 2 family protein [Bacteroidota bacterium]MBK8144792.1 nuclear transport factor 2 family protein [Bacteroidota bacterium]MBP6315449.1 nuclear transport factor 2 family protein [Chitinophagaceae bacterium]